MGWEKIPRERARERDLAGQGWRDVDVDSDGNVKGLRDLAMWLRDGKEEAMYIDLENLYQVPNKRT